MNTTLSHIRILADDLTGAADSVAPLSSAGNLAVVSLDVREKSKAQIASFDGDYRGKSAQKADQQIRDFCEFQKATDRPGTTLWFLKIDSLLRGNVAENIISFLSASQNRQIIVAPAYPKQGRYFANGVVQGIDGDILTKNLKNRLEALGQKTSRLVLGNKNVSQIKSDLDAIGTSSPEAIILVDTLPTDNMANLATAITEIKDRFVFSGSAGLTEAFADIKNSGLKASCHVDGPICFVVGSQARAVRTQIEFLEKQIPILRISRSGDDWANDIGLDEKLEKLFKFDPAFDMPVVLDLAASSERIEEGNSEPVRKMLARIKSHIQQSQCITLSGGDTARAFLDEFNILSLSVHGSFDSGTILCKSEQPPFNLFLKSGGFANEDLFVRLFNSVHEKHEVTK